MRKSKVPEAQQARARQRKTRGHGHERRAEILATAKQLFISEGYEAVTTRQLAERVGISQTGLYVYFQNKEEILEELRRSTFERLGARLQAMVAEGGRGAALLRRLLKGYLEFALEHTDEYQLTFMVTHASLKHHERKDLTRPAAEQGPGLQVFLAFRDEVTRLIAAGVLKKGDPTVITQALWGALHGLAILLVTHPAFPWADHRLLIDTLVETLVKGLQPPSR
jgi:AcrR family transcriptional regulator